MRVYNTYSYIKSIHKTHHHGMVHIYYVASYVLLLALYQCLAIVMAIAIGMQSCKIESLIQDAQKFAQYSY